MFDIYEGAQIAEVYKSIAYSISFLANDKTLEDSEVNAEMEKILKGVRTLGIELRS